MVDAAASCPEKTQLENMLLGRIDQSELPALTTHIEGCARCQRTLEGLSPAQRSWVEVLAAASGTRTVEPGLAEVLRQATGDPSATQAEAKDASEELAFLAAPTRPGTLGRLGHYEVQELIGKGGMGIVLKAFDDKLHRVVAIKTLAPELAASASARKRFSREAQAAAAVSHDHVIGIFAVEEEHRPPFLAMQYVAGISLQDKLDKDGPLPLKEVLRIGMQIASGLAAAHAQGLVHRDIKPANILLENGVQRVKITDFGLARAADDASITQSGVIAGTPMYMSPEQAAGETVDVRSDLFSLGSVLYAMCTGRPPFRANGVHAVIRRVIDDTPRLIAEVNPDVPAWLTAIIAKLLAKKPDQRFQTAKEVAELLGQHLAHVQQPGSVPPPPLVHGKQTVQSPPRPRWRRWAALLLVVALVLGLAWLVAEFRGEWKAFQDGHHIKQEVVTVRAGEMQLGPLGAASVPESAAPPFDSKQASQQQQDWAKQLDIPVDIENALGMKLRLVPPGRIPNSYKVGLAPRAELATAFYAGVHEVTVGDYRKFVEATGHRTAAENDPEGSFRGFGYARSLKRDKAVNWKHADLAADDKLPVACLTWHDAMAFCNWLSKQEGRTYRLPTEIEWVWLARAGSGGATSFGDDLAKADAHGWFLKAEDRPRPVGHKQANPWGLFDVYGNVSELCYEWLSEERTHRLSVADQPKGPLPTEWMLHRGGGYQDSPNIAPTFAWFRGFTFSHIGFRVVMVGDLKVQPRP